jgi:signal transduction histidine kinase
MTISMASWWLIYGLRQIEKNSTLASLEVVRGERMLHWEGLSLILLILGGGFALLYYSLREFHRNKEIKEFFATLTHELKTPLASLRLQVESLQEDLANTEHSRLMERLAGDAGRLELQLENALFLASAGDSSQLHLENLNLHKISQMLKSHWPDLEVQVPEKYFVQADTRALEGVLKNLIQNARVHGQATKIKMIAVKENSQVFLSVEDNGSGFSGDTKKLGQLFKRHTTHSGSGVGLYLAKTLTEKMQGKIEFESKAKKGFKARLTLRGAI